MIGAEKVAASDTYYHDSVCTGLDSLADAAVVEEVGDLTDVRPTGSKCFLSSDKDQLCYSDIQVNEKNVGRDDAYAAGKDAAAVNPDRYANKKTSIYFKRFVYHRILFFIWLYSVSIFFVVHLLFFNQSELIHAENLEHHMNIQKEALRIKLQIRNEMDQ